MSCQIKTGNETLPLIKYSAGKSQPINCTSAQSLVWIKSHTAHVGGSGTDANLDMTFRIRGKDNSKTVIDKCSSGECKCDKVQANRHCKRTNCHEYGAVEMYKVSNTGTCDDLLETVAEEL